MRDDVLALATNIAGAALVPPPVQPLFEVASPAAGELGRNGHSTHTVTLECPEPPIEAPPRVGKEQPDPRRDTIDSLVRPLIESAPLSPVPATQPLLEPSALTPAPRLPEAMELQASLLLEAQACRAELEQSEIRSIVASFQQPTKTALLCAPQQVVIAPAPASVQWMRSPRPRIAPVAPKPFHPADLMFGLQIPPLAGPCIPQDLRNLVETQHPPRRVHRRKKAALPAWTVSFLVALTLFLGVGSLLQYWAANRDTKAPGPDAALTPETAAAAPAAAPSSSRIVEVTGLRVLAGPNRPRLDFIVVNHSATSLSGVGLKIAVRASSSPAGAPPLFGISTTIASLGPYQSREFRAELDPGLRPSDIPDWQSLRAEARLASGQ